MGMAGAGPPKEVALSNLHKGYQKLLDNINSWRNTEDWFTTRLAGEGAPGESYPAAPG
jgi:hypothetical protein